MSKSRAEEIEQSIKGLLSDDPKERIVSSMMLSDDPATALIEGVEKEGQHSLVFSDVLPSNMYGERECFEAMGIVFGEQVEGDELFVHCQLPEGWRKQATDHSLWSDLLDDKGRARASIMYKAAFYDRDAGMRPCCRLISRVDYGSDEYSVGRVFDGTEVLFETAKHFVSDDVPGYQCSDNVIQELDEWLQTNFPDHKDPLAYWDVEDMMTLIN